MLSRCAGLHYLVIAAAGFFAILWVPAQVTVAGDPGASAALIGANRGLFIAGMAGDLVMILAEISLSVLLYWMMRAYGPILALIALVSRLMMAGVMAVMLMPQAVVLDVAAVDGAFSALDHGVRVDLITLLGRIDLAGIWVWQVFFTAHLWALGVLALRSRRVPRLLALGLIVGAAGYVLDSARGFVWPDSAGLAVTVAALLVIVTISELSFALWLTIRAPVIVPVVGN